MTSTRLQEISRNKLRLTVPSLSALIVPLIVATVAVVSTVWAQASTSYERLLNENYPPEVNQALDRAGASLQPFDQGFGDYVFDDYSIVIDRMPPGVQLKRKELGQLDEVYFWKFPVNLC